jgi:hypothetical protein
MFAPEAVPPDGTSTVYVTEDAFEELVVASSKTPETSSDSEFQATELAVAAGVEAKARPSPSKAIPAEIFLRNFMMKIITSF